MDTSMVLLIHLLLRTIYVFGLAPVEKVIAVVESLAEWVMGSTTLLLILVAV